MSLTQELTCINQNNECSGAVDWHTYGGRDKAFTRCVFHHNKRLAQQDEMDARERRARYVDESYAGERYDEDY